MLRVATRFCYSNLKNFNSLQELNAHLVKNRFVHVLVYFRSNWNPQCAEADAQVTRLASQNRFLQVIKVDSDVAPKLAKHYSVTTEPQFIFCLQGDQVLRQIGPNYKALNEKLNKMVQLGQALDTDLLSPQERWAPYGTRFEAYYVQVLKPLYQRNVSDF